MKKIISNILLASFVGISGICLLAVSGVWAAEVPDSGLTQSDLLSVSISDAKIERQVGNDIELSFTIFNRDGIQPQIVYTVILVNKNESTRSIVDQRVYDDVISLDSGGSIHKRILYTAPSYLNGSFEIVIELKNQNPFRFGSFPIKDEITLVGNGAHIAINTEVCFLTISGDTKQYTLDEAIDISSDESLTVHCGLKNLFADAKKITPVFTTHHFSIAGKIISEERKQAIMIGKGDELNFVTIIPKMAAPQIYDTILSFVDEDGGIISVPLEISYIMRGEIVTIQNLSIEKNNYKNGENAKIFFLWNGIKNIFPSNKIWRSNVSSLGKKYALIDVYDKNQEQCIPTFKRELNVKEGGGAEMVVTPVLKDCDIVRVNAQIVDDDGNVFVNNSYDTRISIGGDKMEEITGSGGETSKKMIAGISAIIALILLYIIVIVVRRSRNKGLLILLLLVSSMLIGVGSVAAMGFYGGSGGGLWNYNPNPPGFSMQPIPCPASSSLLFGCGPFVGGGTIISNGCETNTCIGLTCWNNLQTVSGTKVCVVPPTNGTCGSSNGLTLTSAPTTNLCSSGTNSSISGTGPWNWTCLGANSGAAASCTAQKTLTPVNGTCGSSNGLTLTSAPTTNLCSSGTNSSISGTGPWNWTCLGANSGAAASCTAQVNVISPVNGACGSASGRFATTTPTTNLCSTGTASAVTGTNPWNWICYGSSSGANQSCITTPSIQIHEEIP